MDRSRSFVWWRTAIDSGAAGVGVEREAGDGGVARPPTVYWDGELEPGSVLEGRAEGHGALFSPLNPSVTCHTVVIDGERKTVEKREGEEVEEKRTVSCFLFCFFFAETVTDEESIRSCVTRNKMIQEKAEAGVQQIQHHFTCKLLFLEPAFLFPPQSLASELSSSRRSLSRFST